MPRRPSGSCWRLCGLGPRCFARCLGAGNECACGGVLILFLKTDPLFIVGVIGVVVAGVHLVLLVLHWVRPELFPRLGDLLTTCGG